MRHRLLRLGEPTRDGLPHGVELDLLVVVGNRRMVPGNGGGRDRFRRSVGCGFRLRCIRLLPARSASDSCLHVALHDATLRPGPLDLRQIQTFLGRHAFRQRTGEDTTTRTAAFCSLRRRFRFVLRLGFRFRLRIRLGRFFRGSVAAARTAPCRLGLETFKGALVLALLQQHGDGGVDLHAFRPGLHQQLGDGALLHGLDFHRGLVGLDLAEHISGRYGIARLHLPTGQRALLHGGGKRRHGNGYRHVASPYSL